MKQLSMIVFVAGVAITAAFVMRAVGDAVDVDDPGVDAGSEISTATTKPEAPPAQAVARQPVARDDPSTVGTFPSTTTPDHDGGFLATFDGGPADFYDHFDYGFSGQDPASNRNPDRLITWLGDHDGDCGDPTTMREINIHRDVAIDDFAGGDYRDFDEMFWWCRDHLMTGIVSVGYSIGWFSPRGYFENIERVCWDINVNQMSTRQWTQVLFVSPDDATRYPSVRGSGGYDLGFTSPAFRDQPGSPSTGILPRAGDLAGLQVVANGYFGWFENQDHWTTESNSSQPIVGYYDKGPRYRHCIEQFDSGTVRFTQERPESQGRSQTVDVPGQIPQGPVRVVFQDDNYNGPKGERYSEEANTWHWDNILIETA